MPFCLLYVSESTLAPEDTASAIDDIVRCSRARNAEAEVTGALLFSGTHFAQFLEGTEEHVRALMRSIERDPRHRNIVVLFDDEQASRQFSSWSLVYSGPSVYVQSRIAKLLVDPNSVEAAWELIRLMREFTAK